MKIYSVRCLVPEVGLRVIATFLSHFQAELCVSWLEDVYGDHQYFIDDSEAYGKFSFLDSDMMAEITVKMDSIPSAPRKVHF